MHIKKKQVRNKGAIQRQKWGTVTRMKRKRTILLIHWKTEVKFSDMDNCVRDKEKPQKTTVDLGIY